MTTRSRDIALWLSALVGAPVAFAAYVNVSYRLARADGRLPFLAFSEWYWFFAFALCLLGGASAVYSVSLEPRWLRAVFAVTYLGVMAAGLLGVHLIVACSNGDCL